MLLALENRHVGFLAPCAIDRCDPRFCENLRKNLKLFALGNLRGCTCCGDDPVLLTQTSFFSKLSEPQAVETIGVRIGCLRSPLRERISQTNAFREMSDYIGKDRGNLLIAATTFLINFANHPLRVCDLLRNLTATLSARIANFLANPGLSWQTQGMCAAYVNASALATCASHPVSCAGSCHPTTTC
jgi:hypothetical protein